MTSGPTGIILAAGESSRMGTHKALLPLNGQAIIEQHARALKAVCPTVVVVLGSQRDRIQPCIPQWARVVVNHDWKESDMKDSLRLALTDISGPVVVTPVDVPPAPAHALQTLLNGPLPRVLSHNEQRGHPIAFEADTVRTALESRTLGDVLAHAHPVPTEWADCLRSWNTPAEWTEWSP